MLAARVTLSRLLALALAAAFLAVPRSAESQISLRQRLVAALPGPAGVTANQSPTGVRVDWQGVPEAVQYLVLRGPDATTPGSQIGAVAGSVLTFTDAGFNAQAGYQVIAVAADGRRGASAIVLYTPPLRLMTTTTTTTLQRFSTLSSAAAAPVIAAFTGFGAPDLFADVGQTVSIAGTGLDGLTSVALVDAYKPHTTWVPNPGGGSHPVTLSGATATSISFVVGPLATSMTQYRPFLLVVTKSTGVDTSDGAIQIKLPQPVRKITSVEKTFIRAGARVRIHGVGFNEIIGGYFGQGVPGSQMNPLLTMWNRSDSYVELATAPGCKMSGLLMLHHPVTGGTPQYITADTNITVHCFSDTPTGAIEGTDAQGMYYANATSTISIRGTNLRAVTYAVDQMGRKYPVTYSTNGTAEWVSFKLGNNFSPGNALGFTLENVLTDPVVNGTVTGTVKMLGAPTWYRIAPSWAEPGQLVRIMGHDLKNGGTPVVTVGGVPAQVVSFDDLNINFRVPPTATTGPISVTNPGGTVQLTGGFQSNTGAQHPGFFIVAGPSSAATIVPPRMPMAFGDTVTVQGQNLARLGGICVSYKTSPAMPNGGLATLRRVDQDMGYAVSNTEMRVVVVVQADWLQPGAPIQLYAPTGTVGDLPRTTFACEANSGGAVWP